MIGSDIHASWIAATPTPEAPYILVSVYSVPQYLLKATHRMYEDVLTLLQIPLQKESLVG